MKKLFIFIILILLSKPTVSQWVLDYQFTNSTISVMSISITDTNYIWLNTIDSLLNRQVYKKTDQIVFSINTTGIYRPNKLIAIDTSIAFLNAFDRKLYSTTNSGSNWRVCLDSTFFSYTFSLSKSYPNFIVAGTTIHDSDKSILYISSNSGFNWARQNIPFAEDYFIYNVETTDPNHVYVGMFCPGNPCSNLQYWFTSNGGGNWQFKNFPLVSNNMTLLAPIFNVNNLTGFTFAIGYYVYRYKTSNGGLNWTSPEYFSLGSTEGMHGIKNVDSTSIWFCATSEKVFKTTNDGINWSEMTIPLISGDMIGEFDFIKKGNKYYGYLGTAKGKIYKLVETINPIGIQPISAEIPKSYSLFQNYPNPFNPVTKIRFELPNAGNVKLTIFDALGKEIKLLVNENLLAGVYATDFEASLYPSGVYFYRLQSGSFNQSKKMILIK